MTNTEFHRLKQFDTAKRLSYSHRRTIPSKRMSKAKATGTGQWLKQSKIVSETGLETQLRTPLRRGNITEAIKLV